MEDVRMWEFCPTEDGRTCLTGVVQGPPPGIPEGACAMLVDITIQTTPIRHVREYNGWTLIITESGSVYRLTGASRADLIREGLRAKPGVV